MSQKSRTFLLATVTVLLVLMYILSGLIGYAHLSDLTIVRPGEIDITEPGPGASALDIIELSTHLIGAAMLALGGVLLSRSAWLRHASPASPPSADQG